MRFVNFKGNDNERERDSDIRTVFLYTSKNPGSALAIVDIYQLIHNKRHYKKRIVHSLLSFYFQRLNIIFLLI